LILVPTPLGNLRDITLRALDVLRECDLLVAEDTRVARRLLSALTLPSKPTWSYREQNAATVTEGILERARTGTVAVVTDAGMPGISDPGRELVAAARTAGITVEVLPGACAFLCAAVLSGFDLTRLTFCGFVPRAAGERERALRGAIASGTTTAWYEAPARIEATLRSLEAVAPEAAIFIARELTKLHEEQLAGTPGQVRAALATPPRGEFVLVLAADRLGAARAARAEDAGELDLDAELDRALAGGASVAVAARELARRGLGTRAELYRRASDRRKAERDA
jgi:16S rRNA (cytidine1402-2'-O)-methyltransferase